MASRAVQEVRGLLAQDRACISFPRAANSADLSPEIRGLVSGANEGKLVREGLGGVWGKRCEEGDGEGRRGAMSSFLSNKS